MLGLLILFIVVWLVLSYVDCCIKDKNYLAMLDKCREEEMD